MTDPYALLAIGGGAAGFAAARAFREAGGRGPVAIVSDERRMPYRRPPLTKDLLRGELPEARLPLEPEAWLAEHGVSLVSGRALSLSLTLDASASAAAGAAAGVGAGGGELTLAGGRTLRWRSCVLATGAEPKRLPLPGCDDPAVRVVRTLDDVRELLARLQDAPDVVVIGSGFIGCEIAASLRHRGHAVTLISDEPAPNHARLGERAAAELAGWLRSEGVRLRLGAGVDAIERRESMLCVAAGEARVEAPLVVMAAGVAPRSELAAGVGAELIDGAIPVDAAMRTRLPGVLAAGDVCLAHNEAAGRPLRVEHWGDALAQGAVAGATAAGRPASWDEVPGFWSTIGERTLKYAAWGDGYEEVRFDGAGDGAPFTVWYGREGRIVG
ncbi:MAG: NAD(P)/FAD-dependent oxidoreductase, partial [Solirubrobacteraceae bacterium]